MCVSTALSATSTLTLNRMCSPPTGETREQWIERMRSFPTHLCRLRYFGDEDRWTIAWYTYSHEKYEPGCLMNGNDHCNPEEAIEASMQFL